MSTVMAVPPGKPGTSEVLPALVPATDDLQVVWGADRLKQAGEYLESQDRLELNVWQDVIKVHHLRQTFPARARKGAQGWTEFVDAVLKRKEATVGLHLACAHYCENHVPGWREQSGTLPPCYLVAKLARLKDEDAREAFHAELFSGDYEAGDFEDRCLQQARLEKAKLRTEADVTEGDAENPEGDETGGEPAGNESKTTNEQTSDETNEKKAKSKKQTVADKTNITHEKVKEAKKKAPPEAPPFLVKFEPDTVRIRIKGELSLPIISAALTWPNHRDEIQNRMKTGTLTLVVESVKSLPALKLASQPKEGAA